MRTGRQSSTAGPVGPAGPTRRAGRWLAAGAAAILLVAACSSGGSTSAHLAGSTPAGSTPAGGDASSPFSRPGPYTVGVTTLQLSDRQVEVWYPADPGAEAGRSKATYDVRDWLPTAFQAKVPPGTAPFTTDAYRDVTASGRGPFPLVLFSHGYAGFRDQSTLLTTHLASWGFVVAAPDHLERGLASVFGQKPANPRTDVQVLRETADLLHSESASAGGPLHGRVRSGRLAVVGHSAGGFAAIQFGSQPDVATYIPLAAGAVMGPNSPAVSLPDKPSLYVAGAEDGVVAETGVESTYSSAPAPKRLVVVANAGHLAFADVCLIGSGQGGLTAIATSLGITVPPNLVKLATDGCGPGRLDVRQGFTVIDHFVTAQLRAAFGIDKQPAGLDDSIAKSFPAVPFTYRHQP